MLNHQTSGEGRNAPIAHLPTLRLDRDDDEPFCKLRPGIHPARHSLTGRLVKRLLCQRTVSCLNILGVLLEGRPALTCMANRAGNDGMRSWQRQWQ